MRRPQGAGQAAMTTPSRRVRVVSGHLTSSASRGPVSARLTSRAEFTRANVLAALDLHGYCILERFVDDPSALRRDFDSTLLSQTPTGRNRFEGSKTRRCYSYSQRRGRLMASLAIPLLSDSSGLLWALSTPSCLLRSEYPSDPVKLPSRSEMTASIQWRGPTPSSC